MRGADTFTESFFTLRKLRMRTLGKIRPQTA
jgi:hypothetical protein